LRKAHPYRRTWHVRHVGVPASVATPALADNQATVTDESTQCTRMAKQCTCLTGVFVFVMWFSLGYECVVLLTSSIRGLSHYLMFG